MPRSGKTGYFKTRFSYDPRRQFVWRAVSRYLQKRWFPQASAVLDLGCGYCSFINNVKAKTRIGLDVSSESRKHAAPGVRVITQSASRGLSGLKAGSLDVVFASNFLEHLDDRELTSCLPAVRRVLSPSGRFILIQPNFRFAFRAYFDDFTHKQVFTHVGLSDLLRSAGFTVEKVKPRFLPFSFKGRMGAFFWLAGVYIRSPLRPGAGQMLIVASKSSGDK